MYTRQKAETTYIFIGSLFVLNASQAVAQESITNPQWRRWRG